MRVLIAMDSFKGSLTSVEAGCAVREAITECCRNAEVCLFPMADGGEGTVEAMAAGLQGERVTVEVTGPLGAPVEATYCILPDRTAVMEMASAAGLSLVPTQKRDPMVTTTFGVGELIRDALHRGCRRFIIGIGGSATNDGGVGMLSALGYRFLDDCGSPVPMGARGLEKLSAIGGEPLAALKECTFRIACDVTNPLCGPEGCSAVFGPQKGAKACDIPEMDRWLRKYAALAGGDPEVPGAGAAGGLGFAFTAFLGGSLEPGVEIVLAQLELEKVLPQVQLVITGEGRLDGQSVMGKAPIGVARLAKRYGKPVVALCGCVGEGAELCNEHGIDAYFSCVPGAIAPEEAMDREKAYRNLKNTARQVLRLLDLRRELL